MQQKLWVYPALLTLLLAACGGGDEPPAAPADFRATSSRGKIVLTWLDRSDNETGFSLYRRENGAGGQLGTQQAAGFEKLASLSANTTRYEDKTVVAGTHYIYGVSAEGGRGSSPLAVTGAGPAASENRAPAAAGQALSLREDSALTVTLSGSDPDGDGLSYEVATEPAHGRLLREGGELVIYVPDKDYHGEDTFSFRASDGETVSNPATVRLTVTAVNDAPELSIGSPADRSVFFAGESASLNATARDVEAGELSKNIVWTSSEDGDLGRGATLTATLSDGEHVLTASATDGEETGRASIAVQVWPREEARYTIRPSGVASDGRGNVYLAGTTWGDPSGRGGWRPDAFLVKYDADGTQLWMEQFGSPGHSDYVRDVASDGHGNVYVVGEIYGDHADGLDAFIAKYSADGSQLWLTRLGSSSDEHVYGVASDAQGNVYMTGESFGNLSGGEQEEPTPFFVAKWSGSGVKLRVEQFGDVGVVHHMTSDGRGDVYMTGDAAYVRETFFVAKYSAKGARLWRKEFGGPGQATASSVASDSRGNVYVSGDVRDSSRQRDALVVKYDAKGAQLWAERVHSSYHDHASAVVSGNNGVVYVAGETRGSLSGPNIGRDDVFVARYTADGARSWVAQFGSPEDDFVRDVTSDGDGNVYVTGGTWTYSPVGDNVSVGHVYDIFTAKYDATGTRLWVRAFGSSGHTYTGGAD